MKVCVQNIHSFKINSVHFFNLQTSSISVAALSLWFLKAMTNQRVLLLLIKTSLLRNKINSLIKIGQIGIRVDIFLNLIIWALFRALFLPPRNFSYFHKFTIRFINYFSCFSLLIMEAGKNVNVISKYF